MKTLKKNWKNHEFSRCYLFFGEETYLIREYEAALRKAILPDGAEMMNEDSFEEKRATAAAIMDAAETLPFLNDKRLVIVRNSAFFQKGGRKEEGEKLKAFLSNLPETVCLLFIEEKVEKNNALYKAVVKNGQAVEFKKQAEKDLGTWIKQHCKANGMQMSDGVLNLFLQTVDHDMENLDGELQKLIAYKGEKAEIRAEDIRAVCTVSLEHTAFHEGIPVYGAFADYQTISPDSGNDAADAERANTGADCGKAGAARICGEGISAAVKTLPRGRLETGSQRLPASGFGYQIGQGGRGNRGRAFNYEICGVTESFQGRLPFIPFEMYFFRPER